MSADTAASASLLFEVVLVFGVPLAFAIRELVVLRREDRERPRGIGSAAPVRYRIALTRHRRLAERHRSPSPPG